MIRIFVSSVLVVLVGAMVGPVEAGRKPPCPVNANGQCICSRVCVCNLPYQCVPGTQTLSVEESAQIAIPLIYEEQAPYRVVYPDPLQGWERIEGLEVPFTERALYEGPITIFACGFCAGADCFRNLQCKTE